MEHILKLAGFKSFVVSLCLVACASVGLKPSAAGGTYENSVAEMGRLQSHRRVKSRNLSASPAGL